MGGRAVPLMAVLLTALLLPAGHALGFTQSEESQMRAAIDEYAPKVGYPGLVAGVWQRGRGGFVAATGTANLRTGLPMTPGRHHRVGSVTKTMTATLILQLAE